MKLEPTGVELVAGPDTVTAGLAGPGVVEFGPIQLTVRSLPVNDGEPLRWSVAVRGDQPVAIDLLRVVWRLTDTVEGLRMLRNGYHSWSPTDVARLGVDEDPSRSDARPFFRDMHHAHRESDRAGELRSELFTALADDTGGTLVTGFLGGHDHDGTFRLRPSSDGGVELCAEAVLGGAVLRPGETRELHPVAVLGGREPSSMVAQWAGAFGSAAGARAEAPYQVGWCSWYHYFEHVTEADIRSNLVLADDWPFDVFQVDDGYQAAIGDWLTTNDDFRSGVGGLAGSIAARGFVPGLWLAPFIAAPDSALVRDRPGLLARAADEDEPLVNMYNEIWGGFMYGLDTTEPDTLAHLESVALDLVAVGFRYLKLDFTFAPTVHGRFREPGATPAQRIRAGYEAVRRGAGEEAFILACGCPLGSVVGVVDGMRIGPDVAPHWDPPVDTLGMGSYAVALPSNPGAWRSTALRSPLHRSLWLNDPDCLMLRTRDTDLTADQARTWARAVGVSGGMAIVSDDLSLLGNAERGLLDEVIALGRDADEAAVAGHPPVPRPLLADEPTTLEGGAHRLDVDPETGISELTPLD